MSDFVEFPKMARLSRECVITEKIDGTNAQVHIIAAGSLDSPDGALPVNPRLVIATAPDGAVMLAGKRTSYCTPESDNYGFAAWVQANAEELWGLGPGRHFGEWWGAGIQRRYGLTEKRFSLFNVARWIRSEAERIPQPDKHENKQRVIPACCDIVPVLYRGLFTTEAAEGCIERLRVRGSLAAPGFMDPEGVVVFHVAAGVGFKKTLHKDEQHKGAAA